MPAPTVRVATFLGLSFALSACFADAPETTGGSLLDEEAPRESRLDWPNFLAQAEESLEKKNLTILQTYNLTQTDGMNFDLDSATLTFTKGGTAMVHAKVQVVGTHDSKTNTFMWGWANSTIPDGSTNRLTPVVDFGTTNQLTMLTEPSTEATVEQARGLTAVAAQLLGADGSYVAPGENGTFFLVYTSIRWAQGAGPPD